MKKISKTLVITALSAFFLAVFAFMPSFVIGAGAQTYFTYDNFEYYINNNGEAVITKYLGLPQENLVIPSKLSIDTVVEIADSAFANVTWLKTVELPGTLKTIGVSAFSGSGLTSVDIPNSVTLMGIAAFRDCASLESVKLSSSLTTVAMQCFYACPSLKEITIPSNIKSIGNYCFQNCTSMIKATIMTGTTSIGSYAFDGCSALQEVTIPDTVTTVSSRAFFNLPALKSISIGNGVTALTPFSFKGNTNLKNVSIGNKITTIPASAFQDCTGLETLSLGTGITSIGDNAFYGCSSLKELNLPSKLTTLGSSAFRECVALKKIVIPNSVTSVAFYAFLGCTGVESVTIGSGVQSLDWTFYNCTSLKSVVIPDTMTKLATKAFYGCSGLESVYIGNGTTQFGDNIFDNHGETLTIYGYVGSPAQNYANTNSIIFKGRYDVTYKYFDINDVEQSITKPVYSSSLTSLTTSDMFSSKYAPNINNTNFRYFWNPADGAAFTNPEPAKVTLTAFRADAFYSITILNGAEAPVIASYKYMDTAVIRISDMSISPQDFVQWVTVDSEGNITGFLSSSPDYAFRVTGNLYISPVVNGEGDAIIPQTNIKIDEPIYERFFEGTAERVRMNMLISANLLDDKNYSVGDVTASGVIRFRCDESGLPLTGTAYTEEQLKLAASGGTVDGITRTAINSLNAQGKIIYAAIMSDTEANREKYYAFYAYMIIDGDVYLSETAAITDIKKSL